jgi:hypothetical protein
MTDPQYIQAAFLFSNSLVSLANHKWRDGAVRRNRRGDDLNQFYKGLLCAASVTLESHSV